MSFNILPCDGTATCDPNFLPARDAEALCIGLHTTIPWQAETITLWGKTHPVPRLVCWFGDGAYAYSGIAHDPTPWLPVLLHLKARCEAASGARFNSCLANLYRDGRDSMGWHADDEPELGQDRDTNTIASLSLGAPRAFRFRHTQRAAPPVGLTLTPGALLVMDGTVQRHWQHAIPKTAKPTSPRINLTFRWLKN